jgi:glycerol kinase
MNTGDTPMVSEHGLLTTIAWKLGDRVTYALEGSSFIAGAAVQWLRDGLGIIRAASDVERLARTVESTGDVIFVPALAGLGAPHWDPNARGLLWGMTRDTTAAHICRATLEGIAFSVADLALAMAQDAGSPLRRVRVDGGAAANDLMMQFQSDLLDASVDKPANLETTGLGAAYLAGLAVGVFSDLDAVVRNHRIERTFNPAMTTDERARRLDRWHGAVARARSELVNS